MSGVRLVDKPRNAPVFKPRSLAMAPKSKDAGNGKGKSKAAEDDGSGGGKLKAAQSINVRHILVNNAMPGSDIMSEA